MRVHGDVIPETVHMEPAAGCPGMVELRLREQVETVENGYEYDEYVLKLPEKEGMEEEIRKNLPDWLATARCMEMQENASAYQDLRRALNVIYQGVK